MLSTTPHYNDDTLATLTSRDIFQKTYTHLVLQLIPSYSLSRFLLFGGRANLVAQKPSLRREGISFRHVHLHIYRRQKKPGSRSMYKGVPAPFSSLSSTVTYHRARSRILHMTTTGWIILSWIFNSLARRTVFGNPWKNKIDSLLLCLVIKNQLLNKRNSLRSYKWDFFWEIFRHCARQYQCGGGSEKRRGVRGNNPNDD